MEEKGAKNENVLCIAECDRGSDDGFQPGSVVVFSTFGCRISTLLNN